MARKTKAGKKGKNLIFKILLFILIILVVFILDRVSKLNASNVSINPGTAFGFFSNSALTVHILIVVAFIVLALTAFFYFKIKKFNLLHTGLILLFAGTLGNLFDRFVFGHVLDFITLSFIPRFPAFNIADVANVVGVLLVIIFLIKK